MKIKISNAITAALCAAVLSAASYSLGYADADTGGGTGYSSQGRSYLTTARRTLPMT